MTADNVTSSRLRKLSRDEEIREACAKEAESHRDNAWPFDAAPSARNFWCDAIAKSIRAMPLPALRNDAEKYADLRDAGGLAVDALAWVWDYAGRTQTIIDGRVGEALFALRAALAALSGGAE